jgi:hypothetical protein
MSQSTKSTKSTKKSGRVIVEMSERQWKELCEALWHARCLALYAVEEGMDEGDKCYAKMTPKRRVDHAWTTLEAVYAAEETASTSVLWKGCQKRIRRS